MKKLIIYMINLPLYYLSLLIPKNRNIWVFGAWFGEQYSDNSQALYEYVNKNDKRITAIWLTKNKDIIKKLKKKNYKVYYTYGLNGYFYTALAKYIFVSTGMADVNRFVATSKFKVQLWHGTPLKKIKDDVYKPKITFFSRVKSSIFLFNRITYIYLTIPSKYTYNNFKTAFSNVDEFVITGYPRNDILKNYQRSNTIVYLPTHRGEGKGDINTIFKSFDINKINDKLNKLDLVLLIKLHFYDLSRLKFNDKSNIKFIREKINVYELIKNASILITDYSSIYFDFLLTKRPIIFAPFDINEYLIHERSFYYEYSKVTPGPKCNSWAEVITWVDKFSNDENLYLHERESSNKLFNDYYDFNNSKRVYDLIKDLD